jgi:predicted aconitase with swiveling domain
VELQLCVFKLKSGGTVAVNPAVVRFVRDAGTGNVAIVFTENHEIVVEGTIADVMDSLQGRK